MAKSKKACQHGGRRYGEQQHRTQERFEERQVERREDRDERIQIAGSVRNYLQGQDRARFQRTAKFKAERQMLATTSLKDLI